MKISPSESKKLLQAGAVFRSGILPIPFLFLLLRGILLTALPYECKADNRTNIHRFDYYSQEDRNTVAKSGYTMVEEYLNGIKRH
jgi:hypothetical protein